MGAWVARDATVDNEGADVEHAHVVGIVEVGF